MKNIFNLKTSKSRMILLFIVDVITIIVNSYLALIVRYKMDGNTVPVEDLTSVNTYLLINIVTTMIIFLLLNLYNRVWSYASLYEALLVCAAAILSTAFQAFGMSLLYLTVPRSFHLFYFFFLTMTTLITRFSYRILHALQRGISKNTNRPINTMVIGAGEAGNIIITEMKTSKHLNRNVVCVIDDNPSKIGKYIRGVRIVGDRTKIKEAAKKYDVDEIILAIPSADNKDTRDILRICNETTCKLKVLPGVYQLINDEVSVSKLREVSIEDLLGRDTVKIDIDSIAGYVRGKSVLVTGGGGSIGSELCRQIAAHNPRMLIIFDIYEKTDFSQVNDGHEQRFWHFVDFLNANGLPHIYQDKNRTVVPFDEKIKNIEFEGPIHSLTTCPPNEMIERIAFGNELLMKEQKKAVDTLNEDKKELKAEIKGLKSEQRKLNKRLNWYDNSSAARIAASRVKHKIVK